MNSLSIVVLVLFTLWQAMVYNIATKIVKTIFNLKLLKSLENE
jgi:hypothetical protein